MPKVEEYRIAAPFALEELVAAANSLLRTRPDVLVGRRTVRYYIQEGILPPPIGAPKYARYRYEHLLRLVLVRLLLAQGLRLEAIRANVEDLTRGGQTRLEAAVNRLLLGEPEREQVLYCRDPDSSLRLGFTSQAIAVEGLSAPASQAQAREEAWADWEAPSFFQRIPLTDRVSLEIAPGGDLETDLEAAAEALARFLQNLHDTS